jgi:hypothetical protein
VLERARRRARETLAKDVEVFEGIGYRKVEPSRPGQVRMASNSGPPIVLSFSARGRVVGGNFALEIAAAEPMCPATQGLRARGRGVVRLARIQFKPKSGDAAGAGLAERLNTATALQEKLAAVHFERIRVEPDGRPVVRHIGGSVVWMLIPPLARGVPLVPEQARATVDALAAFSG